jgi:hypothetical protein
MAEDLQGTPGSTPQSTPQSTPERATKDIAMSPTSIQLQQAEEGTATPPLVFRPYKKPVNITFPSMPGK